jgi:hypothetical protein
MRLYIYGADEDRHGRHDEDGNFRDLIAAANTVKLPISSLAGLHSALAQLVREGRTFRRVLWSTHGSPGSIQLGDGRLTSRRLREEFAGKGYERLFPQPAKMYFSGCNIAGDADCNGACNPATRDIGWKFLESAGAVFLHAGGYTCGWTSTGYGWNQRAIRWLVSSHSLHFSGDVRHVTFAAGGRVMERLSYDGGFFSGDMYKMAHVYAKLQRLVPDD